jgi:hypothetical protein
MGQRHETRYDCENCRVALCAALFPMFGLYNITILQSMFGKTNSSCCTVHPSTAALSLRKNKNCVHIEIRKSVINEPATTVVGPSERSQ